jgi:hypothetical protein
MEETTKQADPIKSTLAGVNVLLMGPAGAGKTHSIGTLVDAGVEVFYMALEPGLESLLGYYTDRGLPVPANLHWHTIAAPSASFADMIDSATKINTMSFESITKMVDPNRNKYNQFIGLLSALNDFPDDRTDKKYGPVNLWGADKALVIDGLSGLNRAAMSLVVGGKPVKNQADWGIAQDQVEKIISLLCNNCPAHFILIAHVERETDQVMGGVKITVSTLGVKLAPKLPPMFSDVILCTRQGDKWTWDTASALADVKTRNLPILATNPPTFAPIMAKWKARGGIA